MSAPLSDVDALRIDDRGARPLRDCVADEVPVALVYNGQSHAVMMATPADLADFALGFSLSEGIVERAQDLTMVDTLTLPLGISLHMLIPSVDFEALRERRRALTGRAGCGLCGSESLADAIRPVASIQSDLRVAPATIRAGLAALAGAQPWNVRCHGLHAAGFVHAGGVIAREDVGRHNALDKVIGALALRRIDPRSGFCVITSRASHEVVHKAATQGIGLLAAISAPTTLAIRLAEEAGMTLIAFARDRSMSVYSHPERIAPVD